ncbi:hypothetical protein Moror_11522 [Moniliophthora roreri MCA 2997]|uniref:Uncharacterized protein n=2 Tax=Moniliophthora roreri TaxID=221103 RepID=V2XX78_MONRO|nr:hypothetical protein Moror_11522 [Moniliophthora roreri MCA 2997]KAI3596471.1 hypothetical protein WG66_003229 [Moniliophthora roreri]
MAEPDTLLAYNIYNSYNKDVVGYLVCVAQSDRDPDMQGYAVRLSAFVANVCIAILITWSEEEVRSSVNLVLLQVYTILLATAISLIRHNLSIADAHFTLTITISPLGVYFVYSLYRFVRKRPNHLYARLGTSRSSKVIIAILTTIMLAWWIVFDLLIYFSNIFKGEDCNVTFAGWLLYSIIESMLTLSYAFLLIPVLPIFWIIYFIRHFKDIRNEYKRHKAKPRDTWRVFSWVQRGYLAVKLFIIAQWDVIALSHRWLFFLFIFIFYVSWGSSLILWAVDTRVWYYELLLAALGTNPGNSKSELPAQSFDPLGYGQLLAIAVIIEPLYAVLRLAFFRRREIGRWLFLQLPKSLWHGIVFILTGKRNPWKTIREKRLLGESKDGLDFGEVPISRRSSGVYEEKWSNEDLELGKTAQVIFPRTG